MGDPSRSYGRLLVPLGSFNCLRSLSFDVPQQKPLCQMSLDRDTLSHAVFPHRKGRTGEFFRRRVQGLALNKRNPPRLLYPDPAADARPISSKLTATGTPGLISTCRKRSRTPQPSSSFPHSTKATKPRRSRQDRNPRSLFSNPAVVRRAPSRLCAPRRFSETTLKN